ncbi:hypothetical protein QT20_00135, partial [Staphylococcus aureus]
DALLIALDDRGVRDRQAERPLEQRDDGIPVGEAADGRGLGEGRDEAEGRMQRQQRLRRDEDDQGRHQHAGRQPLHAPQLGGTFGIDGRRGKGCGKGHGDFRMYASLRPLAPLSLLSVITRAGGDPVFQRRWCLSG